MKIKQVISLTLLSLVSLTTYGCDISKDNSPIVESYDNKDSSINYQIFIRSFKDSDGDGIGDIKGIISEIPYLKSLGVKNIWLTPIHKTSSDHGYDVIDYYSIASDLGTFDDFSLLVSTLKENNMGVILDMVFNHASPNSEYFKVALNDYRDEKINGKSKTTSSKSNWFNFSTTSLNNYKLVDSKNKIYCESQFDTLSMMDFNLNDTDVISEMQNILKFWEQKGVTGFRFDAVKYYFGQATRDETVLVLNKFKEACPNLYMVGEAWDNNYYNLSKAFESNFDSFFSFPSSVEGGDYSITSYANNKISRKTISNITQAMNVLSTTKEDVNNTTKTCASLFLTNHDMDRAASTYSNVNKLKLLANVIYLLPGTPYIYYGEELGMKGKRGDEKTDANRRMPMLFDEGKCNYLSGTTQDAKSSQITSTVNEQLADANSLLNHYKRLMSIRNKMGSMMKYATFNPYITYDKDTNTYLLTYELIDSDNKNNSYLVITNLDNNDELTFTLNDNDYNMKNIIGYLDCNDYSNTYSINERTITLPTLSTIVIGK